MITILHGDDILQSRQKLKSILSSAQNIEVISLDSDHLELLDLKTACQSDQLFSTGPQKLIIIENFLSKGLKKEFLEYLEEINESINLVFWESKKIDSRNTASKKLLKGTSLLKVFTQFKPRVEIYLFSSGLVFDFLENLRPHNSKNAHLLGHKLISQKSDIEDLFRLLTDHFRQLILVKARGPQILKNLHPFRAKKLVFQVQYFSLSQLLTIFRHLLEFDIVNKSVRMEEDRRLDLLEDLYGSKLPLFVPELSNEFNLDLLINQICEGGEKNGRRTGGTGYSLL